MRFEVPQFIEIEDKIFGPFTWKQFVYLAGGIGIAVVTLFTMPKIIFILIGIPAGSLALLLAFYPVNNRPFSTFLEAVLTFYNNHKVYHWRKKANVVYTERSVTPNSRPNYSIPTREVRSINTLARTIEINKVTKGE
ncbi:MAG: hypothetical protein RLZZ76_409 [Candidatus Parcubacteria bacterium]|jgi:hypothetical protein